MQTGESPGSLRLLYSPGGENSARVPFLAFVDCETENTGSVSHLPCPLAGRRFQAPLLSLSELCPVK